MHHHPHSRILPLRVPLSSGLDKLAKLHARPLWTMWGGVLQRGGLVSHGGRVVPVRKRRFAAYGAGAKVIATYSYELTVLILTSGASPDIVLRRRCRWRQQGSHLKMRASGGHGPIFRHCGGQPRRAGRMCGHHRRLPASLYGADNVMPSLNIPTSPARTSSAAAWSALCGKGLSRARISMAY